ncbi:tRNA-splicing ligase RtcB [Rehaibacterium terrae]|jgi:tRNA-splicing ligase RtcB|uniref:3'-phosphate/5'-hydroxy nucleic acid ligase n=2 Tax=Rehaibacterium terrae TaxID=1341696 RepID=A0A7W8DFK9_9GAMM|nr:RtcB family protein [Rehaibacterium terrae]MBB5016533.1 tRNA-splicing ligase RtcB [Rehaibacterium terrae]
MVTADGALRHGRVPAAMPVQLVLATPNVPVRVWTEDVDPQALEQLKRTAALPFVRHHVAAMPDVHLGIGATVGSVIATRGAIVPAAVGVDIGCGMMAVRTTLTAADLPDTLGRLRARIEAAVPVGLDQHDERHAPVQAAKRLDAGLRAILDRHPAIAPKGKERSRWVQQLGTLGGGNHFIEVCLDEDERVWAMLHSGSRGIGNRIGTYFIARARELAQAADAHLPDRDLAWLDEGSADYDDYLHAVGWAQDYASENRRQMMAAVLDAMRAELPAFRTDAMAIDCHHNYVARERHFGEELLVTRKGAIRAGAGELGIIPGSMGARSYIVRGKGQAESFCSCAHGAGRRMSRSEARRRFSRQDLAEQTRGVECRKDAGVIDEIPAAYKDIDAVMANQRDLVEVVHTLRQVLCVKG